MTGRVDSRRWLATLVGAAALGVVALLACKRSPPTPAPSGSVASSPTALSVAFADGPKLLLSRQARGLLVTSESKAWAEVRVDSDRVKLLRDGAERAKAKRKDYGFKLYDGEREVLSAKRRGAGYVLRDPQDTEIGRTEATTGRVAGAELALAPDGSETVVRRGTAVVARAAGKFKPAAALLLGLTEFTVEQRLVMLLIVNEGIAP
jgi:hypothetical protein